MAALTLDARRIEEEALAASHLARQHENLCGLDRGAESAGALLLGKIPLEKIADVRLGVSGRSGDDHLSRPVVDRPVVDGAQSREPTS